jgi:archaellum component FlaC
MKKKLLPWIIALSALSVSGSAAFYSVSGLGKMFAGASLQVMILAGSLEFAKLVSASLLYEYWKSINKALKYYLLIATLILIIITSAGIYGFLSSAYQETAFKVQNQDKNIEILDKNITILKTEISSYEKQVEQKNTRLGQITGIRANLQGTQDQLIAQSKSTTSVRQQIKDIDSEIKRIDSEVSVYNDSISSKNSRIFEIESKKLEAGSDQELAKEVGPLKYIAGLTGYTLDQVVNWYILILMLVFDPLAVALVLAANFAFKKSKEGDDELSEKNSPNNPIDSKEEEFQETSELQVNEGEKFYPAFGEDVTKTIEISDLISYPEIVGDNQKNSADSEDKYIEDKEFLGYKNKTSTVLPSSNPLSLK